MAKLKLIRIEMDPKYILGFRAVMFLAASPFLWDIYQAFMEGVVQDGRRIAIYGEDGIFYTILIKKLAFALLFLWLCTGGVRSKKNISQEKDGGG